MVGPGVVPFKSWHRNPHFSPMIILSHDFMYYYFDVFLLAVERESRLKKAVGLTGQTAVILIRKILWAVVVGW